LSKAAENRGRQHLNLTAEKQLAQNEKTKLHMRNYKLGLTIDIRKTIIEKYRTREKRLWSTMSPKEMERINVKDRNNKKKIWLGMSPEKRQK
jgi:hypothetical protein